MKKILLTGIFLFAGCTNQMFQKPEIDLDLQIRRETSVVCAHLPFLDIPLEICLVVVDDQKEVCLRAAFLKKCFLV